MFPMHMTVSKKTHCERPGYNLLRAYSLSPHPSPSLYRAKRSAACPPSFRRPRRTEGAVFSERPMKDRVEKKGRDGESESGRNGKSGKNESTREKGNFIFFFFFSRSGIEKRIDFFPPNRLPLLAVLSSLFVQPDGVHSPCLLP